MYPCYLGHGSPAGSTFPIAAHSPAFIQVLSTLGFFVFIYSSSKYSMDRCGVGVVWNTGNLVGVPLVLDLIFLDLGSTLARVVKNRKENNGERKATLQYPQLWPVGLPPDVQDVSNLQISGSRSPFWQSQLYSRLWQLIIPFPLAFQPTPYLWTVLTGLCTVIV